MKKIVINLLIITLFTSQVIAQINAPANQFKSNKNSELSNKKNELQSIESLLFSTYLGGSLIDEITDMFVDASGNIYVCGYTSSPNFPTKPGAYDETFNGAIDAFVCKFNSTATQLIYSTFLGGNLEDRAYSIEVDGSGNAYIAGFTASSSFPATIGAYSEILNGEFDCFVVKLNATGSDLIYSTFIGGTLYDEAKSLRIDASGNAFVCGKTYSTDFPVTSGAFSETHSGGQDIIVFKLNSSGSDLIYSTFLGGNDIDVGHGIDIDGSGNAYILGETHSSDFPTAPGSYDLSFNGEIDVTVTKLNSTGSNLLFSTYIGGNASDIGYGLTLDNSNNVIICGETQSTNYPTTSAVYDQTHNGSSDCFVTKLNSSGSGLIASTFVGGSSDDKFKKIVIDNQQNIYVAGYSSSNNYPTTSNAVFRTKSSSSDVIYCRMNSNLSNLNYSTFLGASSNEEANCIDIDGSGNGYIAGYTMSSDFPTTSGVFDRTHNGQLDGFISKIEITEIPVISISSFGTDFCAGETLNIPYTVNGNFHSSNVFTVKLSDSLGNFDNSVDIGSVAAVGSGSVTVRFPKNSKFGTSYKIRIHASDPETMSSNSTNFRINTLPDVQINGESDPCIGKEYVYSCNTASNTIYNWSVSGGQFESDSTSSTVKIIWFNHPIANLRLIKKYQITGCTDTNTIEIIPREAPTAKINSVNNNVCIADVAVYNAASGSTAMNEWEVMGGVLVEGTDVAKAVVLWTQEGKSYLVLKKTNEWNCVGTDTFFVNVNPVPFAQIYGQNTVVENKISKFYAESITGTSNKWSVFGGVFQGDYLTDTISVLWGEKGVGKITLVKFYTSSGCSDTSEMYITITADLPKGHISGKDTVCENSLMEYSTQKIFNTVIKWTVKNGTIIGADNGFFMRVSWGEAGFGEVKYVITDLNNGNMDSSSKAIKINTKPIVNFPKLPDICLNDSPFLLNMATPEAGVYSGNAVELDYFYPSRAGIGKHTITYEFTDKNGCKNSDFQEITVNPNPDKPTITINESEHRIYSSYEFGNQWFIDDKPVDGENKQWIGISVKGNYAVQHTGLNGCKSDMSEYIILSVDDEEMGISIYPNPVNDKLNINFFGQVNDCKIQIVDLYGRTLFSENYNTVSGNSVFQINLNEFSNGIYLIKLYFSNKFLLKKIIINK